MKKPLTSPVGLSVTGMGPKFLGFAIPIALAGIVMDVWFPEFVKIFNTYTPLMMWMGAGITVIGVLFWVTALAQFARAFPKGKLITNGVYRISRNPIYAAWVVLILPGLALWCNNLWFLAASMAMYIALIRLIGKEEEQLKQIFGDTYREYCQKVGKVGFLPFLIWKQLP